MVLARRFKLNAYYNLGTDIYSMVEALSRFRREPGITCTDGFYLHHFLHYLREMRKFFRNFPEKLINQIVDRMTTAQEKIHANTLRLL